MESESRARKKDKRGKSTRRQMKASRPALAVIATVEPPNNGYIGTFQLSLVERLSSSRRSIYSQNVQLVHFCLSFIGGSTVIWVNHSQTSSIRSNTAHSYTGQEVWVWWYETLAKE